MKKGIHYWALPTEMRLAEKFRFAKECGYDGVELALLREGEFSPSCSERQFREIRKIASDEGVELPSITNTLSWTCSFTSGRREIRERAKTVLKQEIDIACAIGAPAVLALPGFVSMNFSVNELHPAADTSDPLGYHPASEVIHYADAYNRAVEGYQEAASYAEAAGIVICVENIWSGFLLSPLEMRDFIDAVGSRYVRAYFDVGNVRPQGFPEQWIQILGERIERVHCKDFAGSVQSPDCFVPPLAGQINFDAVARALKSIGYNGWVTAEVSVNPQAPRYIAQTASKALDEIFRLGGDING